MRYSELVHWRNICEYLNEQYYKVATPEALLKKFGTKILPFISPDRKRREQLWKKYAIQLIIWDYDRDGWQLKGNWEDKIWFLEQIVLFGRSPDELPKRWLEKWDQKQQLKLQKEEWEAFLKLFGNIEYDLGLIAFYYLPKANYPATFTAERNSDHLGRILSSIKQFAGEAKTKLREMRQPDEGSVVLSPPPTPLTDAAVLGEKEDRAKLFSIPENSK